MSSLLSSSAITTTSGVTIGGSLNVSGTTALASTLSVTGATTLSSTLTTTSALRCSISTPVVSSVSQNTTNVYTFPSAGVWLLLVSTSTGTSSSTINVTDNLTRVCLCVVSSNPGYQVQIYNLGNSSTGFFSITSTSGSQYTINFTTTNTNYGYNFWTHQLF